MHYLEQYALSFLGTPYRWGGDDPKGIDCSGYVIELMKSCGIFPHREKGREFDTTAQGIHDILSPKKISNKPQFGALVFFGVSKRKITHVGFMIDKYRMIEAGGGGKRVKTVEDAIKYNAFIRIRPIKIRNDVVAIVNPNYTVNK